MSDSEESYSSSQRSSDEEDTDGLTSSESDGEEKYLTYPNRNLRWPVGSPKPINPVRGTPWNKSKGLRLDSKDQQDLKRYVPGRMPKLVRKAEAGIAADYKEGGAGSTRAQCQVCKEKIIFSTDPEEESKELMQHVLKCWEPTDFPAMGIYDERVKIPTVLGHFAAEEDEECLLLSVHSPGAFGGAYIMVLAFPLNMMPDLTMLDATLRREWFHEKCPHLSMFVKRDTGSVEEERKMYNGYKESMVLRVSKKTADMKFLESSTNGYQRPGRVVWARQYKGAFWPAVVMEEEGTGILARRDPTEDEQETWDRHFSLQWHVVFLGREGKRMWARDGFDTFKMVFSGKEDATNWCDIDRSHLEGEEKIQWEAAVEMATKLAELESDEEVLKEVTRQGLTGGGEEIKDGGMMEMLVHRLGEEEANRLVQMWKKDPGQFKWSFYRSLYAQGEIPYPLPVEKMAGFSYWPLMGVERGTEDQRKEWEKLLVPDRTDLALNEVFTKAGETAIYQYHLVDGFRSRCKVVFLGKKLIRLRGKCRRIPCGDQLIRDPEYERDLERIRRTTGGDGKPTQEEIKKVYHCMPPIGKPSILVQNEPPFIPCTNCKVKTAEFCDTGRNIHMRSFEDPDSRIKEHTAVFCSTSCGRAWSEATKTELPTGNTMDMENSPRVGMCEFSNNIFTPLHLMPLHKMERELFPFPRMPGHGLYAENGRYIDDERAEGRHHPLWLKEKRRKYRENKRGWQDLILGRIDAFGLETPPPRDHSKVFYD